MPTAWATNEQMGRAGSYCTAGELQCSWNPGNDPHNWSAVLDGYELFRRDRPEKRGSGGALYGRESFDCLERNDGDELRVYKSESGRKPTRQI